MAEEKIKQEENVKKTQEKTNEPKQLEDFRTLGEPSEAKKGEKKQSESAVKKAGTKEDKKKKTVESTELERIYVIPMRRGFLKVPRHKRAKKAIKTLKEFLARHMKVENRDLTKVKIDKYLNNEIWHRGIKKPLNKVKVLVKKVEGIVYAELLEIPEAVKYKKQKDDKKKTKVDKKKLEKVVSKEAEEEKKKLERSDKENKEIEKEKSAAVAEAGAELNKELAKAEKHTAKAKDAKMDKMSETSKRKAMKR